MGNITLSIPNDVHADMKLFSDVRWSEVARRAIVERLETLKHIDEIEKIAKKSKLTAKDAKMLSKKINRAATQRMLDELNIRL